MSSQKPFASILRRALTLGSLAGLAGCGAPPLPELPSRPANSVQATRANWDVNDISVLYPLRSRFPSPAPGRLVRLVDGGGLLSQAQFDAVLALFRKDFNLDFSKGAQASLMNRLDTWAVTAFRLDPCFKRRLGDPCTPQVRIVAQAVVDDDSTTTDFAIHLFYTPKESTRTLLDALVTLRETHAGPDARATLGKPLGVHPILAKSGGLASPFAQALKNDFLLKYLSWQNLSEIAVSFIEPSRLQPWVFFRTDARSLDTAEDNSIFAFDPESSENACGVADGRQVCRRDIPKGRIVDSLERSRSNPSGTQPTGHTPEGKPYLDDFLRLTLTETDTKTYPSVTKNLGYWQGVINQLENPRLTAPGDTNCASCHRAMTERVRFRGHFTLDPAAGDTALRTATTVNGCTPGVGIDYSRKGMKTFNVRMFGYLHDAPIVAQRVANETWMTCEELKRTLR